jgi:hypothetical protein
MRVQFPPPLQANIEQTPRASKVSIGGLALSDVATSTLEQSSKQPERSGRFVRFLAASRPCQIALTTKHFTMRSAVSFLVRNPLRNVVILAIREHRKS